ncbi:MAG: class I adenylate-forming enzyme family protein [Actinomycetota bacterium]
MASLRALLADAARTDPVASAFVEGRATLSFEEWNLQSDRVAGGLASLEVAEGEVVALCLPNGLDYPVMYLGSAKAGCVTTGINTRFREREIAAILKNSGAAVLVTLDQVDGVPMRALAVSVRPPALRRIVTPDEVRSTPGEPRVVEPDADQPLAIVYTSGTTGIPKGACYTHGAIDTVRRIEMSLGASSYPRSFGGLPLPHMNFMTKIGSLIERRACMIFMGGRWSARAALEMIEEHGLTGIGGVPTQLELMLRDETFESRDLSSVRSVTIGGAPATPDLIRRIRNGFGVPVMVRYSCTEVGLATGTRPDDDDETVATTVGRPLPSVEVIVDAPAGEVGEILVRSPAMMRGYWNEPDAIDQNGFFHTGDLGWFGADGNLRLSGRAKDMYIRAGYNVYPAEVEAVLQEHPKVALCAVVGVPDDVLGQRGLALVVPTDPADPPTLEELRDFVGSVVADYKRPDALEIRPELPMTPLFKVDKAALGR